MSLKIYYDDSIKKDKRFILDIEPWFSKYGLDISPFSKKVIKDIDKGELVDNLKFIDRFGMASSLLNLSTSSKALLLVGRVDGKILNLEECGVNIGNLLLEKNSGEVYIPWDILWVYEWGQLTDRKIDVFLGEKQCKTGWELYEEVRSL